MLLASPTHRRTVRIVPPPSVNPRSPLSPEKEKSQGMGSGGDDVMLSGLPGPAHSFYSLMRTSGPNSPAFPRHVRNPCLAKRLRVSLGPRFVITGFKQQGFELEGSIWRTCTSSRFKMDFFLYQPNTPETNSTHMGHD
jgi:hypothetical protein